MAKSADLGLEERACEIVGIGVVRAPASAHQIDFTEIFVGELEVALEGTDLEHDVETEIRPFRDILMGLFFITVGMQLDLMTLPSILHWVGLLP